MPGNFHKVPAWVIAKWPKPNYIDPVRRSWLPALSCTLLGVSTLLVAGRFYLRARNKAGDFGLDDLFIGLGWLFSVGLSTEAVINAEWNGLDVHTWDVPLDRYVDAALTGWISQVLFIFSVNATKASVLLFYRRMAKDTYSRIWLYAIWAALALTAGFFIACLITFCLICRPLSAYWESYAIFTYHKEYTCIDGNVLTAVSGVLGVISDVYAVLLPCLMLRHYDLDVPRRQKIVLNIIFGLGFIVAGCGIARTYYLWQINHTYDTSWTGFDLFVWALLECHLAIIFACAPSLRAFFRRYLGGAMSRTFRSGSYNRSAGSRGRSQNTSALRNSNAYTDPEIGKAVTTIDQQIIEKPSQEAMDFRTIGSGGTRSSFTVTNPEEYEVYNMRQLSKHRHLRRHTNSDLSHDWNDPKPQHDPISWLDDGSS